MSATLLLRKQQAEVDVMRGRPAGFFIYHLHSNEYELVVYFALREELHAGFIGVTM